MPPTPEARMLPDQLTETAIREVKDEADTEVLDDVMSSFFEDLADELAAKFSLDDEQREELFERLAWDVVLLSPDQSEE